MEGCWLHCSRCLCTDIWACWGALNMAYCYPIAHHSFPQLPPSKHTFLSFHFTISTMGMHMTQCFGWVMSACVCVVPCLATKDFGLLFGWTGNWGASRPDTAPASRRRWVWEEKCTLPGVLFGFSHLQHCSGFNKSSPETKGKRSDHDNLAKDSAMLSWTESQHKNSLDVKIIALIVHHAQWLLLEAEYMCLHPRCPADIIMSCMTNPTLPTLKQLSAAVKNEDIYVHTSSRRSVLVVCY